MSESSVPSTLIEDEDMYSYAFVGDVSEVRSFALPYSTFKLFHFPIIRSS